MPYEYSAENHDWDLTLRSAAELVKLAQVVKRLPDKDANIQEFSCLTGSMVLSFCSIESYATSVAFTMSKMTEYEGFDFDKYRRLRTFWEKLEMVCGAIPIEVDKSKGVFQKIAKMQKWRNLVTHASPYEISKTKITNTSDTHALHRPMMHKNYPQNTNIESAISYYNTALGFVNLVKEKTGIEPHAQVVYKVE